jgi:hypothetical protein
MNPPSMCFVSSPRIQSATKTTIKIFSRGRTSGEEGNKPNLKID